MMDHHVFGRFIRPPGALARATGRPMQDGHHPRHGGRLLSAAAALTCGSATLSCGLAALASGPAASLIQSH